jgi:SAM-dependent methyltransferase
VIAAELDLLKRWMGPQAGLMQGPILDVGSSTLSFRQRPKLRYDLGELLQRPVVCLDMKAGDGVDIVGDAEDLKSAVGDEWFAGVVCTSLLEHTRRPWRAVDGMCRWTMPPGGRFVLTAPWRYPDHADPIDCYRFSPDGLRALVSDYPVSELAAGKLLEGENVISYFVGQVK